MKRVAAKKPKSGGKHDGPDGIVELPSGSSDGGVFVAEGLDPAAAQYAARTIARAQQRKSLSKYNTAAGGAQVRIPRLDQPHEYGKTMAQQVIPSPEEARLVADRTRQALMSAGKIGREAQDDGEEIRWGVPAEETPSIVEMPQVASLTPPTTPQGGVNPMAMGILATDILPPEASRDPAFREGHGSMLAYNQPMLASKYGVIRGGVKIPPQQLSKAPQGPQRTLSPQSLKDLETLKQLKDQQNSNSVVGLADSEDEVDDTLDGSAAAASARIGNLPGDEDHLPSKGKPIAASDVDELTFDQFRQRMMRDILNNEEQKKRIEKDLPLLEIDDLITKNRVEQKVPVVVGFAITFQSMTGGEDLALKRLIMEESNAVDISDRYLLDKYSLMAMTVGTFAINGKPIGEHCSAKGEFDDDLFWKKFKRMLRLPVHMLASIGVNHFWFEQRVRKLFVSEKVGNG